MVNTRGWRLLGATLCAAALAVAGCGGDDPAPEDNDSDSQGPLAEFFGWDDEGDSGPGEYTEEERQQHYQVEELVVACMQEAGFEYQPQPFWGDTDTSSWEDPFADVWQLQQDDPEEFARQYGYGATTIDYDSVPQPTEDASQDPNAEYYESLSEAAREEYDLTLWGDWEAAEEAAGSAEDVSPEDAGGCYNEASAEVYGDRDAGSEFDDLFERWDQLYTDIEADPRLTAATDAWKTCMAEAGYPDLEQLYSGQDLVYERQSELYGWDREAPEESGDEAEAEALPATPEPLPEPDPDAVAELREFELAIAWADYECRRDHDVERIQEEVTFEHEQRFLDANRAELEAYRDWQNEQGGGVG